MMDIEERFLKYVGFNTQAVNGVGQIPSSTGQIEFARYLVEELKNIGLDEVEMYNGVVYAKKSSDFKNISSSVGFVSHIDTYPMKCKKNIEPFIVESYCGIESLSLLRKNYPSKIIEFLNSNHLYDKLIFSKGKTLLGVDNKAGIAEIVSALEYIYNNDVKTVDIYVAFVCDEELGKGAMLVDSSRFKADYVYVMDGEYAGEIQIVNMNLFSCCVRVRGDNAFLGAAKGVLKNSIDIVTEFMNYFPTNERPQYCDNKEGFYFFSNIQGDVFSSVLTCSIMDFDENIMKEKINKLYKICEFMNLKYGEHTISIMMAKNGYTKYCKNDNDKIVLQVENALKKSNLPCKKVHFRGLTDATIFRAKGVKSITVGVGGSGFHSIYEWVSVNDMKKVSNAIVLLCKSIF